MFYDLNGYEKANSVQFYVYEPNYDGHVDGSTGAFETKSIDGKETLVDEEYMIRQTASRWSEYYPVLHHDEWRSCRCTDLRALRSRTFSGQGVSTLPANEPLRQQNRPCLLQENKPDAQCR